MPINAPASPTWKKTSVMARHVLQAIMVFSLLIGTTTLAFNNSGGQHRATCTSRRSPTHSAAVDLTSRRGILKLPINLLASSVIVSTTVVRPEPASALPFEKKDRRQLELCLVAMLRLQYWAESLEYKLRNAPTEDYRKSAYLEARLGSKAIASGKVGGGATGRVFALKGLEIKECLADLRYYAKNKNMDQLSVDLIESIASVVEFDGLETTQDPSPRSTLTLSMYNSDKALFVTRMLGERVSPIIQSIVQLFPKEAQQTSAGYILQYYYSELPPDRRKQEELARMPVATDTV